MISASYFARRCAVNTPRRVGWSSKCERSVEPTHEGFVIGIVFTGLVLVILGFAAVRMASTLGGERPVSVPDTAALVLNLFATRP